MLFFVYTRTSSDDLRNGFEKESIPVQVQKCKKYVEMSQVDSPIIAGVYKDPNVSGRKFTRERAKASQMIKDIRQVLIKNPDEKIAILVNDVTRLARRLKVFLDFCELIGDLGIKLHTVARGEIDLTSPEGFFVNVIMSASSQFQVDQAAKKSKESIDKLLEEGRLFHHADCFGYRKFDGGVIIFEKEAEVIRLIFKMYQKLKNTQKVADWLNDNGYVTKNDCQWVARGVNNQLNNRRYVGEVKFRGVWHQSPFPPIITEEEYDKCQVILQRNARSRQKISGKYAKHLLSSGVLRCGLCLRSFAYMDSGPGRFACYRCTGKLETKEKCTTKNLRVDIMEPFVKELFGDLLSHKKEVEITSEDVEIDKAKRKLEELESEFLEAKDSIERSLVKKAYKKLAVKLEELEKSQREIENLEATGQILPESIEGLSDSEINEMIRDLAILWVIDDYLIIELSEVGVRHFQLDEIVFLFRRKVIGQFDNGSRGIRNKYALAPTSLNDVPEDKVPKMSQKAVQLINDVLDRARDHLPKELKGC